MQYFSVLSFDEGQENKDEANSFVKSLSLADGNINIEQDRTHNATKEAGREKYKTLRKSGRL